MEHIDALFTIAAMIVDTNLSKYRQHITVESLFSSVKFYSVVLLPHLETESTVDGSVQFVFPHSFYCDFVRMSYSWAISRQAYCYSL